MGSCGDKMRVIWGLHEVQLMLSKLAMIRVMVLSGMGPDTVAYLLLNGNLNGNFVALFLVFLVAMLLRNLVALWNSVRRAIFMRNIFTMRNCNIVAFFFWHLFGNINIMAFLVGNLFGNINIFTRFMGDFLTFLLVVVARLTFFSVGSGVAFLFLFVNCFVNLFTFLFLFVSSFVNSFTFLFFVVSGYSFVNSVTFLFLFVVAMLLVVSFTFCLILMFAFLFLFGLASFDIVVTAMVTARVTEQAQEKWCRSSFWRCFRFSLSKGGGNKAQK